MDLYAQRDPILKAALAKGLETDRMAIARGHVRQPPPSRAAACASWRRARPS